MCVREWRKKSQALEVVIKSRMASFKYRPFTVEFYFSRLESQL